MFVLAQERKRLDRIQWDLESWVSFGGFWFSRVLLVRLLQQLAAALVAARLGLPCGLPLPTPGFLQVGVCIGGLRSGL